MSDSVLAKLIFPSASHHLRLSTFYTFGCVCACVWTVCLLILEKLGELVPPFQYTGSRDRTPVMTHGSGRVYQLTTSSSTRTLTGNLI